MARLTRKELKKKDPFLSVYYDDVVEFAEQHYPVIIIGIVVIMLAIVGVYAWKRHQQRQALAANAALGAALDIFHAPTGEGAGDAASASQTAFSTPKEKYQAALKQFTSVYQRYPGQKAGMIALYHIGLCQGFLGNNRAALRTLEQASHVADGSIASLARLGLANELVRTGNMSRAEELYQELASHPTAAVPAPTALLALANAERATAPARARQIYERLVKDYSSDKYLTEIVEQELSSLAQ